MQYVMLTYQGPVLERQAALLEDELRQVYADYSVRGPWAGERPIRPRDVCGPVVDWSRSR